MKTNEFCRIEFLTSPHSSPKRRGSSLTLLLLAGEGWDEAG